MANIRIYLLVIFIAISRLLPAQEKSFNIYHYGPEDGLSNNNVWATKQGPDGLLYISTQNGVFSFDGYSFIKIKAKNLKTNYVRNVNFDTPDLLVVNREEGIFSVNKNNGTCEKLQKLIFENKVDELIISGDFAYSLSDQIEISAINIKTGEYFDDDLKSFENRAFCIYKSKEGRVYVGRNQGLYWFNNGRQEKVKEVKNEPIYSITADNNGNLALGSSNKIILLNKNYKVEKELFPKFKAAKTILITGEKDISKLIIDRYNRYWFTTYPDNNLFLFENNITYDVFESHNIAPVLINHLTKDNNENIWVSTFNDGIYFVQNPFFNSFAFSINKKVIPVNEILIRNKFVFAATGNGLYSFNGSNYQIQTLSNPDEVFGEPIYNIAAAGNNIYYSKTVGFGFKSSLIQDGALRYQFKPIASKYILPLDNNSALVAEAGTVYRITIDTEKILDTIMSFKDYRIKISSMFTHSGNLYIGTSNGLTTLNLNTHKIVTDSLFDYAINHITENSGNIYIAHENGFTNYTSQKTYNQLGEIKLSSVKKIKFYKNYVWFATLNGLYLCDLQFNPVTVFNKSCGLMSNTINDISFEGDNVCIATDKGISLANIETLINFRNKPAPVKLIAYETDQQSNYTIPSKISLKANQGNLAIYFSSPFFSKPNNQYFKYTDEHGKVTLLENKQIQINSIKGGTHKITISASLDNISWSEPVTVEIEKEISFGETGWLAVIISLGGLVLVVLVSFIWVKQVKKKTKKRIADEQQINLLKHQAMNSLLSPHFIFNSLTSIQNYINTNNSLMASEYLAKFSRLIRMIIEKAAQSQISLKDEVVRLNYYLDLEKERFKNKFDFIIEVAPDLNTEEIKIPNMIIQPHAENSIIHGILPKHEHGTLKIFFAKKENNLVITIEDDGIGLIKAKEHAKSSHKSLGTSTISSILELNSKLYNKKQSVTMEDKSLRNASDHGTIITIKLEL